MKALQKQLDKDQLDFEKLKEHKLKCLEKQALQKARYPNSNSTPTPLPLNASVALWRAIASQPYETVLEMVSQHPPSILATKDEIKFICAFYSGFPANVISLELLKNFNHINTMRGQFRSFKKATNPILFNNYTGKANYLYTTTDFCWYMGGKRFIETFFVDDVHMLRSENAALGWHFRSKHRVALNFGTGHIKIPHTKFLSLDQTEEKSPFRNHPPYQPYM
jgi:hypothetical protein